MNFAEKLYYYLRAQAHLQQSGHTFHTADGATPSINTYVTTEDFASSALSNFPEEVEGEDVKLFEVGPTLAVVLIWLAVAPMVGWSVNAHHQGVGVTVVVCATLVSLVLISRKE